jgi:hypothetical protein
MSSIFRRLRRRLPDPDDKAEDSVRLVLESRTTAENSARGEASERAAQSQAAENETRRQLSDAEARRQGAENETRRQLSDAEARRDGAEKEVRHRSEDGARDGGGTN